MLVYIVFVLVCCGFPFLVCCGFPFLVCCFFLFSFVAVLLFSFDVFCFINVWPTTCMGDRGCLYIYIYHIYILYILYLRCSQVRGHVFVHRLHVRGHMFEVCMFVSTMPKLVRSELWHLFRLWRREVVEIRFWRAKRAFYRSHAQWRGICFRRWALRTLLRSYFELWRLQLWL
jgi:hypothetical protein